jgi:hypothetical protein
MEEVLLRVYTAADTSQDRRERRPIIDEADSVQRKVCVRACMCMCMCVCVTERERERERER